VYPFNQIVTSRVYVNMCTEDAFRRLFMDYWILGYKGIAVPKMFREGSLSGLIIKEIPGGEGLTNDIFNEIVFPKCMHERYSADIMKKLAKQFREDLSHPHGTNHQLYIQESKFYSLILDILEEGAHSGQTFCRVTGSAFAFDEADF